MTRCEFAIRSPLSGVIHGIDVDHLQAFFRKFKAATAAGLIYMDPISHTPRPASK